MTEQEKKRLGRKPMTPEEKAAAAEARAAEKAKADSMRPEFIVQYQGGEIALDALAEAAKADFRTTKKRTLITGLKLYVIPDLAHSPKKRLSDDLAFLPVQSDSNFV